MAATTLKIRNVHRVWMIFLVLGIILFSLQIYLSIKNIREQNKLTSNDQTGKTAIA